MKTCPFITHLLGEEQSEILTIDQTAKETRSSKSSNNAGDAGAPRLHCLMESCRFYHHKEETCAFDTLFADLKNMKDDLSNRTKPDDTIAPRITRELNKFWKFQTKSVTELISHMSDLDQAHKKNLESIQEDLKQHLTTALESSGEPAAPLDTEALQALGTRIDQFQELQRGIEDHLEKLALEQTEVSQELDAHIEDRLKALAAEQSEALQELGARIDQVQEQRRSMEDRLETLAAGQDELLAFFKADKNRRDVEWLRSNKKEARTFNNLGVTSFHNGAFQTAREQFEKAIELDPEFAEVYNNLGLVHTELGEEEKASEAFKQATELNPDMTAAYTNLGYLLHKQGSYEEAIEMYNEVLGRSAKSSSAYTNLGNAYFKLGKSAEAEEAWEKALEIDPSNEKATLYLKQLRAEKL